MMRDSTGTLSSLAEAAKGNSQAQHVEFVSRKRFLRTVSSSCKIVDLYCNPSLPLFDTTLAVTETLNLRGQCVGSAETGTLGLLAVHAAGGVVCST